MCKHSQRVHCYIHLHSDNPHSSSYSHGQNCYRGKLKQKKYRRFSELPDKIPPHALTQHPRYRRCNIDRLKNKSICVVSVLIALQVSLTHPKRRVSNLPLQIVESERKVGILDGIYSFKCCNFSPESTSNCFLKANILPSEKVNLHLVLINILYN